MAALYADQALLLPPDHPAVTGRQAIQTFWEQGLDSGLTLTPFRVETAGHLAYIVGRWYLPADSDEDADSGKFVLCLTREGGAWKVTTDIWNSSVPDSDSTDADSSGSGDGARLIRFSVR